MLAVPRQAIARGGAKRPSRRQVAADYDDRRAEATQEKQPPSSFRRPRRITTGRTTASDDWSTTLEQVVAVPGV